MNNYVLETDYISRTNICRRKLFSNAFVCLLTYLQVNVFHHMSSSDKMVNETYCCENNLL